MFPQDFGSQKDEDDAGSNFHVFYGNFFEYTAEVKPQRGIDEGDELHVRQDNMENREDQHHYDHGHHQVQILLLLFRKRVLNLHN